MTSLKEMDNDVIYYSFKSVLGRFYIFHSLQEWKSIDLHIIIQYIITLISGILDSDWSITAFHSRIFLYNEH